MDEKTFFETMLEAVHSHGCEVAFKKGNDGYVAASISKDGAPAKHIFFDINHQSKELNCTELMAGHVGISRKK